METRLLAFSGIAMVITVTPGPDMALVTRVVFGRGRVAAWLTSLGVVSGHLLWGLASALGVTAVLSASAISTQPCGSPAQPTSSGWARRRSFLARPLSK